jgi:radical SAM protein (TIGR01212 family)
LSNYESKPRYRTLSSWLKAEFGEPVRKITIDAGLTCPNRDGAVGTGGCIFCNARGSGTGAAARGLSIEDQVDAAIASMTRRGKTRKFIAYFQSFSNTYGEIDRLADLYRRALSRPEVVGLAVGARPDCASEPVLDLLADIARTRRVWVEYGLQSAHERTLRLINRGHGPAAFFDAAERTASRGLPVAAHVILGLPGETLSDMAVTAQALGGAGVWGVKLHILYVIAGTRLAEMYLRGDYAPMTEAEATEAVIMFLERLHPETVIHRLTSDPHPEELLAPQWMLDRSGTRMRLESAMTERDVRQGARWGRRDMDTPPDEPSTAPR